MITVPTSAITLPSQASNVSAATRCTSPMSVFIRVTICPSGVAA